MSDIKFYCTSCGKKLGIDTQAIGLMVPCPQCGVQLRVPAQSQERSSANKPVATRPPGPEALAPRAVAPQPPSRAVPPPDPAALGDLKRQVQKLKEQNSLLLSEAAVARKKVSSTEAEVEKLRTELKGKEEELSAVAGLEQKLNGFAEEKKTWDSERNELTGRIAELMAGQDEQENKISQLKRSLDEDKALTVEKQQLQAQIEKLSASCSQQEKKVADLEAALSEKNAAAKQALDASAGASEKIQLLEKKNAALAKTLESKVSDVTRLTKERDELLKYKTDAAALTNAMAELQSELKELRNEESALKQTVEEAERVIVKKPDRIQPTAPVKSDPWQFSDPFRNARKWAVIFAGVAIGAILCSMIFVVLWQAIQKKRSSVLPPVTLVEPERTLAAEDPNQIVELGVPFVIDDVEVIISRARIAPVEMISLLGEQQKSEKRYFILDIRLSNRSPDRELILRKPWADSRLLDDQSRLLRPAFTEPIPLQEVRGVTLDEAVAPGDEIASMMVFEWPNLNSVSFTLTVDPGFKKLIDDNKIAQISYRTFSMTIPRVRVVE